MQKLGIFLFVLGLISCNNLDEKFPKIGRYEVMNGDTTFHQIPDFKFVDQDSNIVTNENYEKNIYIADFFYTSCPSICPIVTQEMLKIYDEFVTIDRIKLVSHTLDPVNDTAERLKMYGTNIGVDFAKWQFLTGDKYKLSEIASEYLVAVVEDSSAPGGIDHSGKIIMIDENRHIRAFCEGTDPKSVDKFIKTVKKYLKKYPITI